MDAPDLITLEEFKRTRKLDQDVDDDLIVRFIHAASKTIHAKTGRHFVPYTGTRVYDGMGVHLQNQRTCLDLDDDLLTLTSVTDAGVAVSLGNVVPENANFPPYWRLALKPESGLRWGGTQTRSSIVVSGVWGFHQTYANAWTQVATITAGIDESQTTIPLSNIQDVSRLSYLKIGDEIMQVDYLVADSEDIIVRRAQRGTTGASALNGASVSVYSVEMDVAHGAARLTSYYYDRRDSDSDRVVVAGGQVYMEARLPPETDSVVNSYRRSPVQFT